MKIAFLWWTMGPYHFARMNAIARLRDVELTVYEVAPVDDHNWNPLNKGKSEFKHVVVTNLKLNHFSKAIGSFRFAKMMNEEKFDFIIDGSGYSNLSLNLFGLKSENLVLWSESTLQDNPQTVLKSKIVQFSLQKYKSALVAGKRHRELLNYHGFPDSRIFEVGNVVDNGSYSKSTAAFKKHNSFTFLFVGRLLSIKNVDRLILAFKSLLGKFLMGDPKLIIVGDGPEREPLMKMADGVNEIEFVGSKQPNDLVNFYHQADVFILPSISEPWGLVVNEAMASGLPLLLSEKCGCIPELMEEGINGLTFNPYDAVEIASKMERMMNMKASDLNEMGNQSLRRIENYSPELYAEKVYKVLLSLKN